MPCEVVGLHFFADSSEAHPLSGVFDVDFIKRYAIAHEEAGFDRILIGQTAKWPDGISTASYVASFTKNLKFMVAHRPGFVAPTMAARAFATLDQVSKGRVGIHIITGGHDKEMEADGDFTNKAERYSRSLEYVDVLRKMWASERPFDYQGKFYRMNGAFAHVKPYQNTIPIYWAGTSDEGIACGAQCADVYAIGPGTVADVDASISRFKNAAAVHGRQTGLSMSMRIIIGDTEEAAWAKAHKLAQDISDYQDRKGILGRPLGNGQSQWEDADPADDIKDERYWVGLSRITKGRLHASALVGTPDQVAEALMKYYQVGVDRFLLNGFFTIDDVMEFGRDLVPTIKRKVAEHDAISSLTRTA